MTNPASTDKNVAVKNNQKSKGKAGMAVIAGMAGAAAGATLGVALADKKNRAKLVKLATQARDALEELMVGLRDSAEDINVEAVKERVKKGAKDTARRLRA